MKAAGLLLLPAGLLIVAAAVDMLPATPARAAFIFAGIVIELLGLVLVGRANIPEFGDRNHEERRPR